MRCHVGSASVPRCEGDWKGEEDLEGRGLEGIWRWIWRELEEGMGGFGRTGPREDLERGFGGTWKGSGEDLKGIWRGEEWGEGSGGRPAEGSGGQGRARGAGSKRRDLRAERGEGRGI